MPCWKTAISFLLIDMSVLDTSVSPLSYRRLILLVCLVSEMAYPAGLSPLAASISLSGSISSYESELTDG